MIPFFVVDRPLHLDFFETLAAKYDVQLGLMGNALSRKSFQEKFKTLESVDGSDHPGLIKFLDSGVFGSQNKRRKPLDYPELFDLYEELGTDYGIMLDVLHDSDRTIMSALRAQKIHNEGKYSFKLVAVAQGNNLHEYLHCYEMLRLSGFRHIAIGGLLKRRNTHNANVASENFLKALLTTIRRIYPIDWLFALGVYSPARHRFLEDLNLYGADGRGWIFRYSAENHLGTDGARQSKFNQREAWIKHNIIEQIKPGIIHKYFNQEEAIV